VPRTVSGRVYLNSEFTTGRVTFYD
jgi:hypothetical protein